MVAKLVLGSDGILVVLHLLYEGFVKAEGVCLILEHKGLKDEPQAATDFEEFVGVCDVLEIGLVG